jgi:hypothetical protein
MTYKPQQWIAFRIISKCFIQNYIHKNTLNNRKPLRMLLTGPGGTGKSHVVKAVHKLMEYYGAGHTIRFLAPTGSAASLINGMTIHKGLGIKVQSTQKGKGNRKIGDDQQDYSVIISTQNKVKLRNEWRHVETVMIDECSLLSAELLSEIDAALRFAKENPEEWFGGVTVIFAGDFYQYPPVCATPLYNSISASAKISNTQLAKRLGRLAWKSVDTVITFTEQKRMEQDPEYATAVTHLRRHQCTLDDVDLFNTRVIKSATHENGVDMGIEFDDNFNATAIVRTNLLRELMNIRKAQTNASIKKIPLTTCAALDTCSTTTLTATQHEQLLHLDMSSSNITDGLPGFLPLYVNMPVILRCKNISTDLGITNGSQGYLRHFEVDKTPTNVCYCTCALVEFPNSKVHLPDLPNGYFPIVPVKSSFITQLPSENGQKIKLKILRSQLPIQPAFAVTGHSAEGKTLPTVLTNLHEGGFAAYVAASRARSRKGLFITEPVTLSDLNDKPIPYNLLHETKRLDALEHNTYLRFGFQHGHYQQIPNPESEQNISHTSYVVNFEKNSQVSLHTPSTTTTQFTQTSEKQSPSFPKSKRKQPEHDQTTSSTKSHLSPKIHQSIIDQPNNNTDRKRPRITKPVVENRKLSAGCTWSQTNWSCAYDVILMSVFYAYLAFNNNTKIKWSEETILSCSLALSFQEISSSNNLLMSSSTFNTIRDRLRDYLSNLDANHFPRHGAIGAPAELILHYLTQTDKNTLYASSHCSSCFLSPILTQINDCMPSIFFSTLWTNWCDIINQNFQPQTATTQKWIDLAFEAKKINTIFPSISHSTNCTNFSNSHEIYMNNVPSLLFFETAPDTIPIHILCMKLNIKTCTLNISTSQYILRAIIYNGSFHFTARLFDPHQNVWTYDSQKNDGFPSPESISNEELQNFLTLDGRSAHIYIYSLL